LKIKVTVVDDNGIEFIGETKLTKKGIQVNKRQQETDKLSSDFKGLSGGINFLISQGFLNTPKTSKQVFEELKKEGYYHSYPSVDKALRVVFVSIKKTLRRIKEKNVWQYVKRR